MEEEAEYLETAGANRPVWFMRCPAVVSRAWQEAAEAASDTDAGGANPNPNPLVAKVFVSLDPLPDDAPLQFKMEMAQADSGNLPKSYSLNVHNDFVPMCIFSESKQGKLACEGKVVKKFDMKPHRENNLLDYGRLCRERTNMSMVKQRQTMFISKDNGEGMRPLPGQDGGHKEKKKPSVIKPYEMKRTRMDPRELEKVLFKHFERKPNWSVKQLMQELTNLSNS